ncbi:MAG: M23 family metallopeptidase, partial [Chloroflexota bacterium]|nr:M23 family metallopeptidase [Chloroflexota bacterium]
TPTSTLPSLEFSIPSPTATTTDEVVWRPPAYPVPWAPTPHDHFYFSRPIAASDVKLPFTNYRYANVFFGDHVHTGMDIPADIREPVLAAGDGKVVWAGYGLYRGGLSLDDPYGNSVVIRHSFGYQGQPLFTVYAHLNETTVRAGDVVSAGDEIGLVGNTGESTGPHLHFEVRVGENDFFATYNPALWLSPPQGWGVLAGQIMSSDGRLLENESVYIHSRLDVENEEEEDEVWIAKSYTMDGINSDSYYQENFVLSDLPAGYYRVNIPYIWTVFTKVIEIRPGEVTYITFEGWKGINVTEPPEPEILFTPAP